MEHTRPRFPVALKLVALAGVPVVGALLLAVMLAQSAQRAARSAEALGTVEDLAQLADHISGVVHGLQTERAVTALAMGSRQKSNQRVRAARREADSQLAELQAFLAGRQLASFPPRLARDLGGAQRRLVALGDLRQRTETQRARIDELLDFHSATNQELISAIAGLTQLSNDGELLRSITLLVSTLEVKERVSQEQAVLAHVFASGSFAPGLFRALVTLASEQDMYDRVLRSNATDEQIATYEAALKDPSIEATAKMRKTAMEAAEGDDYGVRAEDWYAQQNRKIIRLRSLEQGLNQRVRRVAQQKVTDTERSVRTSLGLCGVVLLVSLLLASLMGRGISRSIGSLSRAAAEVHQRQDYSVRVQRTSADELGVLTDAFNHMLQGIQGRDQELHQHRKNLEELVMQRTRELAHRNAEMRVVLDTVEQGLVTIDREGRLGAERSAAFSRWFASDSSESGDFAQVLAGHDPTALLSLRLAWEAVIEDFLPLELTLEQLPKKLTRDGHHFALDYKPIFDDGQLSSLLLIVSDTTDEVHRLRQEAEQGEFLAVFERVMKDRAGFVEFFNEASALADELATHPPADDSELLRQVHTLKGNAAIFGVGSVSRICHLLEEQAAETGVAAMRELLPQLVSQWSAFAERVVPLIGTQPDDVVEVRYDELESIAAALRAAQPHARILTALERLKLEPTQVRFQRIAEQARALARRLGRGEIQVEIRSNDVRLPSERWHAFWGAFMHAVRNAIDHGLEPPGERLACGKSERGQILLHSRQEADNYLIELADDGRGIDWDAIRRKASALGLPCQTEQDLVAALFADRVSSRDDATLTSGRGVGMGAVAAACRALGGTVQLASRSGQGTIITVRIPAQSNDQIVSCSRFPGARPSLRPPASLRARALPPQIVLSPGTGPASVPGPIFANPRG